MEHYISFPALGWTIPIHRELLSFTLFGREITIYWYSVMIVVGLLLALWYGFRHAKSFGIKTDPMIDVVMVCVLFGVIGARLYYVLFSEDRAAYFADPLSILKVWEGGLAIYGGVIVAFLTGLWICPLRKVKTLRMYDLASIGFLIGQAVGRWGNFFNQEAFGGNTTLPWGMTGDIIRQNKALLEYDQTQPVHPTFLYESLWCILGLILLHIVSKKAYKFGGQLFTMYLMWYGTGRFFIETLRTDSLMVGALPVSCLVAAVTALGGLVLFFVFKNYEERLPKTLTPAEGEEEQVEPEDNNDEESTGEDIV